MIFGMPHVRYLVMKMWHSPTLMTWGSFLSRSIGFLLVLPLAIRKLEVGEIVVWYLFSAIYSFQWILDLGFGSTLSRAVAYAAAGASTLNSTLDTASIGAVRTINVDLLNRLRNIMRRVYFLLAILSFLLVALFGTWALLKPVGGLPNEQGIWIAWALILLVFPVNMYGNQYPAYLEGMNEVALVRRWDMFFGVASNGSMILALLAGAGLLGMVVCSQIFAAVRIILYWRLAVRVDRSYALGSQASCVDKDLLSSLWAGAWRSGVGGVMSYGLAYAATFLVAHKETADTAASYLISARLLDALLQLSQAPFYSKLPVLTRLRATNQLAELMSVTRNAMAAGYWSFLAGFLALAFFADRILILINSNATFASAGLWCLMGLAAFAQFYGAMHIQLYSTTNHIVWHVANSGSGAIFILIAWLLIEKLGSFAIPIAWLGGYIGFYSWYSASHSYKSLKVRFLKFEAWLMFPPLLILLAYCAYVAIARAFMV